MPELLDRQEIKRVRLSSTYAITVAVGMTAEGNALGEILTESRTGKRAFQGGVGALVCLRDALAAAVVRLDAHKAAAKAGVTAPEPPPEPEVERGYLASVHSGGRSVALLMKITRDDLPAIVLQIRDAKLGNLAQITFIEAGANVLATKLAHFCGWVFSRDAVGELRADDEGRAGVEVVAAHAEAPPDPAPAEPRPVRATHRTEEPVRRPGQPPASWLATERARRAGGSS